MASRIANHHHSGRRNADLRLNCRQRQRVSTDDRATAWHVGWLLIGGYDGGGIPASRVLAAVTAILDTPSADTSRCVAYSKYPNDTGKPCVWNVSAAAAWFLWRADQRGIVPAGRGDEILTKLCTWRDYVRAHYSTSLGGWTYQDNTTD